MLKTDFTIVGGGIMGLLTARELHEAGASVTLLEQGNLGKESSWAGGGILLPLYPWRQHPAISILVIASLGIYPTLNHQLFNTTGINPEWYGSGLLITQNSDLEEAIAWCKKYEVNFSTDLPTFSNPLNTLIKQPLFLPEIAQIRNPRLISALTKDLQTKGCQILENCQIQAIHQDSNKLIALTTNQGDINLNEIILTTGAWTTQFLNRLLPDINKPAIQPVKGQMILFKADSDTLPHIVLAEDRYLIPRLDGHILVGSTVEDTTFHKATTAEAKSSLAEFALETLPALQKYPLIRHWAGLRPGTVNGVPYISRHPKITNLSFNAGHFRNGFAMAPASARLLTDLLLGRPPIVNPEPYRLN